MHFHPDTEFKAGQLPAITKAVGSTVYRRDKSGAVRAWVKTLHPNVWQARAYVVWESVNGVVPRGMLLHHVDRDTLNDAADNLRLLSRAEHLAEHRSEYVASRRARFAAYMKGTLMLSLKSLVSTVAEQEGKKVSVSVGNVREVLRIVLAELNGATDEEIVKFVRRCGKKRSR